MSQPLDAIAALPRLAASALLALGLVGAVVAGLGGCGAAPNAIDVSGYPPEMQRNYQIFEVRCSRCHGLERPITARVADGGWMNYVRRMSRHPGAGISDADQRAIAAFLEYHHRREAAAAEAAATGAPTTEAPTTGAPTTGAPTTEEGLR